MLVAWLGAAEPPVSSSGIFVYLLGAALTAALGTSGFQFYKYRKQAGREDDSLIAAATGEAVAAAKEMLVEYRVELNRAREDLLALQVKLDNANERIVRLENDLKYARGDRERLQDELTDAIERRAVMQAELEVMRGRMAELERVVRGSLEREDERRHT